MSVKVKVFDEEHEKDLEKRINETLSKIDIDQFIDIKYQVHAFQDNLQDQIYIFSAMLIYVGKEEE